MMTTTAAAAACRSSSRPFYRIFSSSQFDALWADLTVKEHLELYAKLRGIGGHHHSVASSVASSSGSSHCSSNTDHNTTGPRSEGADDFFNLACGCGGGGLRAAVASAAAKVKGSIYLKSCHLLCSSCTATSLPRGAIIILILSSDSCVSIPIPPPIPACAFLGRHLPYRHRHRHCHDDVRWAWMETLSCSPPNSSVGACAGDSPSLRHSWGTQR